MTGVRAQTRTEIRSLLERHGLRPRKHLGQHFLADPNLVDRIVRVAGIGPGDRVIEIGVGTGTLTRALAAAGAKVLGFEIDARLEPLLAEALTGVDGVAIRFEDAMEADMSRSLSGHEWVMVANLPYNIGTPLVIETLRGVPDVSRLIVMVQREVADRLVAAPGSPAYGLPSVALSLRATARFEFTVPPQVFLPVPAVESAVVTIERGTPDPLADSAEALASAAFNQRRKMLRRSLTSVLVDPAGAIEAAGLDPSRRAEDLSAGDYLRLAAAVQ